MSLLDLPLVARVRRNHALEHATIHVLTEKHRPVRVVGRSTLYGFYLYGNLTAPMVSEAAHEALARLQAGEHHLAVHPNCGTNLVASGSLAGLATFAVLSNSKKRRLDLLPSAFLAATTALLLAQPIGPLLQARVTTLADLSNLTITDVRRQERGNTVVHFVATDQA
jgi:hypothetical protein